jgi:hypothetical protein
VCEPDLNNNVMGSIHPHGALYERPVNVKHSRCAPTPAPPRAPSTLGCGAWRVSIGGFGTEGGGKALAFKPAPDATSPRCHSS